MPPPAGPNPYDSEEVCGGQAQTFSVKNLNAFKKSSDIRCTACANRNEKCYRHPNHSACVACLVRDLTESICDLPAKLENNFGQDREMYGLQHMNATCYNSDCHRESLNCTKDKVSNLKVKPCGIKKKKGLLSSSNCRAKKANAKHSKPAAATLYSVSLTRDFAASKDSINQQSSLTVHGSGVPHGEQSALDDRGSIDAEVLAPPSGNLHVSVVPAEDRSLKNISYAKSVSSCQESQPLDETRMIKKGWSPINHSIIHSTRLDTNQLLMCASTHY